ncbi:MAG: alpha/beta fold hydrolase [Candidatus Eremiobacteraeota bacterium]|nr:alpha/beta fold hydrolase [Candidatus Eremiobacteraeota bacterium]
MQNIDDATRERLARFLERDHESIGDSGRSLLFERGVKTARAFVFLHGLTASPTQFETLARAFYERGNNVIVPRLPRHGYRDRLTPALATLDARELREMTRETIAIAAGLGERVTVVGFSLGGLLAAWAAQFYAVDRVVVIAPFLGLAWLPSRLLGWSARLALLLPNRYFWWDPRLREEHLPAHGYPRYSTHAAAQSYAIVRELYEDVRVRPPLAHKIVVVLNAHETTVNNRAAYRLAARWQAFDPEAVCIETLRDLPPSHDIIEPARNEAIVERVFPKLVELIEG